MAYTSEFVTIDGTRVKIATGTYGQGSQGRSQTVNVFDDSETEGNYQQVYRIREADQYVTPRHLFQAAQDLPELDRYLVEVRAALREGARRRRGR